MTYDHPRFRPDGRAVYFNVSADHDQIYSLTRIGMAPWPWSGEPKVLTAAFDRSVSSWTIAGDGKSIFLTAEDEGLEKLYVLPAEGGQVERPAADESPEPVARVAQREPLDYERRRQPAFLQRGPCLAGKMAGFDFDAELMTSRATSGRYVRASSVDERLQGPIRFLLRRCQFLLLLDHLSKRVLSSDKDSHGLLEDFGDGIHPFVQALFRGCRPSFHLFQAEFPLLHADFSFGLTL
jgi:hypothetical protein